MTKVRTMLIAMVFTLASTPLLAGASDFAGAYIGVTASFNGVEIDGSASNSNSEKTVGTIGKVFIAGGGDIGYTMAMGDTLAVSIGATMIPGEASMKLDSNGSNAGSATSTGHDITVEVQDAFTIYIAPTIAFTDSASFYGKIGYAEADIATTGDATGSGSMDGIVYALGSRTLTSGGLFIQTEAGIMEYDTISFTKTSTTGTATADPSIAYGSVTVGIKF
jgi:hypothetical protein